MVADSPPTADTIERRRPPALRRLWRTFRALPHAEQRLTLRALVVVPCIGLSLRLLGYNTLLRGLSRLTSVPTRSAGAVDVAMVARAVDRAARRWPAESTCLTRSLALWWLLRRRSVPADVWVGVRRGGPALEAHAWVEVGGRVINDRPDIRELYQPFEQPVAATP